MEDFIDYILFALLFFFIAFIGLLVFLLRENPIAGYILIVSFILSLTGGATFLGWKLYKKKQLGRYYEFIYEISQSNKEIHRSTKRLERHIRKIIREQYPKIDHLCQEAQKRVYKIVEIDNALSAIEKIESLQTTQTLHQEEHFFKIIGRSNDTRHKYRDNIQTIKRSKSQYLQEIQQILRFLQELNSRILAMKYSQKNSPIQAEIAETIDELLIEIQTLEEVT